MTIAARRRDRATQAHAVRDAAERLIDAVAAGDGAAVVSLLSAAARDALVDAVARWDLDCATEQEAADRVWFAPWPRLRADARCADVHIEGDRAVVTVSYKTLGRGGEEVLALTRSHGQWLVDAGFDDAGSRETPVWALVVSQPAAIEEAVGGLLHPETPFPAPRDTGQPLAAGMLPPP